MSYGNFHQVRQISRKKFQVVKIKIMPRIDAEACLVRQLSRFYVWINGLIPVCFISSCIGFGI